MVVVATGRVFQVVQLSLTVNGERHAIDVAEGTPLLWVLRDALRLTGTKYSCGIGVCGSCTVHVGGTAARSCVTPVDQIGDRAITTIEGLAADELHPVQAAWLTEGVSQCGYCQPGQIMTAAALLSANPLPTDEEIDEAMDRVLCRCGTYLRIRRAVRAAARSG
jgi:isoquinoline 1-oxidoreductase alpha subunit